MDPDVFYLDSYLVCMEARLSDDCHDGTCAKMSDAGAPCPGDAVSSNRVCNILNNLANIFFTINV